MCGGQYFLLKDRGRVPSFPYKRTNITGRFINHATPCDVLLAAFSACRRAGSHVFAVLWENVRHCYRIVWICAMRNAEEKLSSQSRLLDVDHIQPRCGSSTTINTSVAYIIKEGACRSYDTEHRANSYVLDYDSAALPFQCVPVRFNLRSAGSFNPSVYPPDDTSSGI